MYFFDYSVIHQTNFKDGAGARLSMDSSSFHNVPGCTKHHSHPRFDHDTFYSIGRENLIVFHAAMDDLVNSKNSGHHKNWDLVYMY